jgi:hypothetical protein
MKRLFQNDWFGIKFSDLEIDLSMGSIADVNFYSCFYQAFYNKFHGYNDLPKEWRSLKDEIVNHIYELLGENDRILSIGCGVGYVEDQLCLKKNQIEIIGIEPGTDVTKWINKKVIILHGLFPSVLDNQFLSKDFDFVFASSIDYVFDDRSYAEFLKSVFDFGVSEFLLTEIFVPDEGLVAFLKTNIKLFLETVGIRDVKQSMQFWGYLRTIDEHLVFLRNAGFSNFDTGKYNHGAYYIMAKV